jgi:glycosyltransferase involved in cell wall biosynthesis
VIFINRRRYHGAKKICFLAPSAYSILTQNNLRNVIGPDIHQIILAKQLRDLGYDVAILTYAEDGPKVEIIDGLQLIKIFGKKSNSSIGSISKIFRIWNSVRLANADIYYIRGAMLGVVSPLCRLLGKKVIYSIASDALVDRDLITRKIKEFDQSWLNSINIGNWVDIKMSNVIIVQSSYQKDLLYRNYNKESVLIKTPYPIPDKNVIHKSKPLQILWVGSMAEVKQPELFLDLAKRFPEANFCMIGGHANNQEYYDNIKQISTEISNLDFLGVVPYNEIDKYFCDASILINTSLFEGYPHAFIQAWAYWTPVISLHCNPDNILSRYDIGIHSKTYEQLVEDLSDLIKNKQRREELAKNGRNYIEDEHDIGKIIWKYISLFETLG